MKSITKKALFTGMALALAGAAHAAPITTWNVNVSTVFGTPNTGVNVVSPTELSWGTGSPTATDNSGLIIGNSPSNTFVNTNGALVPNVTITHRNNPIISGTGTLLQVPIISTLTLKPSVPDGSALPSAETTFTVRFFETPNTPTGGVCADGTANGTGLNINGCADIFVIDQDSLNFPFQYADIGGDTPGFLRTYFISFLELTSGLNPLPDAACNAVAGVTAPCRGFRTAEATTTTVQFAALITTPIPEPGSLALMGLGLGALGLIRRRKLAVV